MAKRWGMFDKIAMMHFLFKKILNEGYNNK